MKFWRNPNWSQVSSLKTRLSTVVGTVVGPVAVTINITILTRHRTNQHTSIEPRLHNPSGSLYLQPFSLDSILESFQHPSNLTLTEFKFQFRFKSSSHDRSSFIGFTLSPYHTSSYHFLHWLKSLTFFLFSFYHLHSRLSSSSSSNTTTSSLLTQPSSSIKFNRFSHLFLI